MPIQYDIYKNNMDEIQGLNQRGGRMLSIVDLIARGTIDLDLAVYLLTMVLDGASFLCCALQGGVGKTTLMGALLGLLPPSEEIVTVASEVDIGRLMQLVRDGTRRSLVVHEIGSGSWFGYIWGKPVLDYIALKSTTTRIVSNIHADTIDDVEKHLRSFGGTRTEILAFDLILFISLGESSSCGERVRIVNKVLEMTGEPGHQTFHEVQRHDITRPRYLVARDFLQGLLVERTFRIEDVAARVATF